MNMVGFLLLAADPAEPSAKYGAPSDKRELATDVCSIYNYARTDRSAGIFIALFSECSGREACQLLRALCLTQPTLGRHIDALEAALGVRLFARSQHGLLPTQAALDLAPHAEAMESAAESFVRAASGEANEPCGAVSLTASNIVGAEVLPAICAIFVSVIRISRSNSFFRTAIRTSCAATSTSPCAWCGRRRRR
jgi:DNA-binding transcriptional ArsR family regulator